jgi:hypothetical protein
MCTGAVKIRQQDPTGRIKDRFKQNGFQEMALRVAFGRDCLPDTLREGVVLLQDGDSLVPLYQDKDISPELHVREELEQFPGVGSLSFTPLIHRPRPGAGMVDVDEDLEFVVAEAIQLVQQGAVPVLEATPFVRAEDMYELEGRPPLQPVLDVVSDQVAVIQFASTCLCKQPATRV